MAAISGFQKSDLVGFAVSQVFIQRFFCVSEQ